MVSRKRSKLNITCTSTDCNNGLHCFKPTRKMKKDGDTGKCRECGADLIDWSRVHQKEILDAEYTFKSLKYELIRHEFWHRDLTKKAINYAKRKGYSGLKKRATTVIKKYVDQIDEAWDGRQTPMDDEDMNAIHYAQHGTATCCRKCVEYWHGIPKDRKYSDEEIEYLADLIMLYIKDRFPPLTDDGENVPPIRKK